MQAARDPPSLKYERASPVPKMPDANPIQPSPSRFLVRLLPLAPVYCSSYADAATPLCCCKKVVSGRNKARVRQTRYKKREGPGAFFRLPTANPWSKPTTHDPLYAGSKENFFLECFSSFAVQIASRPIRQTPKLGCVYRMKSGIQEDMGRASKSKIAK